MLRSAFNILTRIHGKDAQLRRPGNPDFYSPCRVTPSNYFRFQRGPEFTDIHGREFIIPTDTVLGHFSQIITFEAAPDDGTFKLSYNSNLTTDLAADIIAADLQIALRLLPALSKVVVTGDIVNGFEVSFQGFSVAPLLLIPENYDTLVDVDADPVTISVEQSFLAWGSNIKRGDRIIESEFGTITIDEIIEIPQLGGGTMGLRVRAS